MHTVEACSGVWAAIQRLRLQNGRLVIAIDGRCAAGKTTLAKQLAQQTACRVFHMDDFFLRPEQRTAQRLDEPGGNVDYERFLSEVLLPLRAGEAFSYRPYDCSRRELTAPVQVQPGDISIVEGAYSCHPTLKPCYDLSVFLSVEPDEQLQRILARNGEQAVQRFREMWIPLEERYIAAYDVANRCDLFYET